MLPLRLIFCSAVLVVLSAFSLGGGASNGYLSVALTELCALPALILATWSLLEAGVPPSGRFPIFLFFGALIMVALQLMPLPPSIWTALPFHEKAAVARATVGAASVWAPLSVDAEASIVSFLAVVPPLAMYSVTLCLGAQERRILIFVALLFGFINGFVGLLQLSQGEDSVLYLYGAEPGVTVGLFANRNHEAALLYSLVPFAAAWIGSIAAQGNKGRARQSKKADAGLKLLIPGVTIVVLIVGALMAQSRAGVILLIFSLVSGIALQSIHGIAGPEKGAIGIFGAVSILALVVGSYYGMYRTLSRLGGDLMADARVKIAEVTYHAALKALPFGAGLGSFVPAYASIEKPNDLILDRFANQAHNDYLQIALEAGVPGMMLATGFLLWISLRIRQAWATSAEPSDPEDVLMMRAATISIALLLTHSLVDYPLRTEALLVFFAFCCGLLVPAPDVVANEQAVGGSSRDQERDSFA
jgi:O-antigen ligase